MPLFEKLVEEQWALNDPTEMRSGILYAYAPIQVGLSLYIQPYGNLQCAWAAVGPALFWGRDDGVWVPYSRDYTDQNAGMRIRDRAFPFSWGDVIWTVGQWWGSNVMVRFHHEDDAHIFVAASETGSTLADETYEWAREEAGPYLGFVDAAMFTHEMLRAKEKA